MDGLARFATFVLVFLTAGGVAFADERPKNVDEAAHEWLSDHIEDAMPFLLQTSQGPIDETHISIVEELGNWGAARAKGKHQGNDFVLDFPHEAGSDRVLVGSILEGRVVHLEHGWGSYGNTLFVQREVAPKFVMIYAHLDELDVAIGDAVAVGDIVGSFGCTGNCRGLAGKHVRNQVHVELYAMPDDFEPEEITWDTLPMRQLRARAHHDRGAARGVDIRAYFGDWTLSPVTRAAHGERYAQHAEDGGFAAYLADEDVATAMALAAEPPLQDGTDRFAHIAEPGEDAFYYNDDSLPEDLVAREMERHAELTEIDDAPSLAALNGVLGPETSSPAPAVSSATAWGRSLGAYVPDRRMRALARTVFDTDGPKAE